MYVCNLCGHIKDDSDLKYVVEPHGERHIDYYCHCCNHGQYIEATECPICGEYFDNTELHGVCEGCLEECETVGEALAIGEINTVSVDGINGAVAELLTVEQINKILEKFVEENFTDHSKPIVDYCEADKSYFSEYIENKYGD